MKSDLTRIEAELDAILSEKNIRDAAFCRYERIVIRSLRSAGIIGNIRSANCNDSNQPDADMVVRDNTYYVEVKASARARMGSASVGYSYNDRAFFPTGVNTELSELAVSLLEQSDPSLKRSIDRLIRFLAHASRDRNRVMKGFPLSGFSAASWVSAREANLLVGINTQFNSDITVIGEHYAQKGVHYIQIGGAGLFYLIDNPAKLPVPRLEGSVTLEVAANKSGDIAGRETSRAALRIHPRIETTGTSPFTLDDPDSIALLLASIGESSAQTNK